MQTLTQVETIGDFAEFRARSNCKRPESNC